jgi:hypothetical protein
MDRENPHADKANHDIAKEEERYREEVSQGEHGAHRPCEKFPIEEAREEAEVENS